jgi:hypothetical protein
MKGKKNCIAPVLQAPTRGDEQLRSIPKCRDFNKKKAFQDPGLVIEVLLIYGLWFLAQGV